MERLSKNTQSNWTGAARLAAKVSPTLLLLVERLWPRVALSAVPFGTLTVAVGCGCGAGLAAAAVLGAAGFAAGAF